MGLATHGIAIFFLEPIGWLAKSSRLVLDYERTAYGYFGKKEAKDTKTGTYKLS